MKVYPVHFIPRAPWMNLVMLLAPHDGHADLLTTVDDYLELRVVELPVCWEVFAYLTFGMYRSFM